jgi:NAD(P)-dependent dehydrogenase (short-subunit alcohol dehydrogenase family)
VNPGVPSKPVRPLIMEKRNDRPDRFSLADRVVLLTGGAGLYGRGLAADLTGAGATLIVASRDLVKCQVVADEEKSHGGAVFAEQYDQGSEDSIKQLLRRILERFGRIDGLVNNSVARPMTTSGPVLPGWEESMRINATGLFLMHHYFGGQMAAQKSGSIVNIGSIQGMMGPDLSLYVETEMPDPPVDYFFHKGGMINLTRFYASTLGRRGVRVNCVSPGGFLNDQPELFVQRYKSRTFLGRMGNNEDVGGAVIFLLSDAAGYITGVNLPVDGGYTAK